MKIFPCFKYVLKYYFDYNQPPGRSVTTLKHKTVITRISNFPGLTPIQVVCARGKWANIIRWFQTHLFFRYVVNILWFQENARSLWRVAKTVYFSALVPDFGRSLFPNTVLRLVSLIASVAQHCQARTWKSRLAPLYSWNAKSTVSILALVIVARANKL